MCLRTRFALVKLGHMLETLSIRRYSFVRSNHWFNRTGSENPFGADNQQERPRRFAMSRNPQRLYAKHLGGQQVVVKLWLYSESVSRNSFFYSKRLGNTLNEDIVRAAWRHAEASRNDWPASLLEVPRDFDRIASSA